MSDRDDIGSRIWPFGASPAWFADPIVKSVAFILVASALFLAFPGIDPWFSGLFYDPATGFPMSRLGAFTGLRRLGDLLVWATVIGLVAGLIVKLAKPERPTPVAPRDILFLLSTLALGPGVLVNLILKENWGRPRPADVAVFGGEDPFVGVWRISDYCVGNCSFVSGEAAAAAWLVAVAIIAPPRWRRPAAVALLVVALLLSLNRIAFGRHFLSDVLIAWGLTLLVLAALRRFTIEHPPAWLSNDRLEAGLTWLGQKFRRGAKEEDGA